MKLGWPWRKVAVAEIPAPAVFDVSIDLDPVSIGPGVTAEQVRDAVAELPGAGWVSVEPHGGAVLDVRLFQAGSGFEAIGAAWDQLRQEIVSAIRAVSAAGRWDTAFPAQMGFAESAAQFDALEQLTALAATRHEPEPRAKRKPVGPAPVKPPVAPTTLAPVGDDDVFRLSRLLALVLPVDGREPATAAVRRFGSFAAVLAAPEAELQLVPGLGVHSISAIKLVHAAAIRHARAGIAGQPVLDDPKRLADYLAAVLARERIEQFRILFLDADGMLKADEVQAQGTVNHTPVYPREVVRRALALQATSLILVHNHPSGDPAPSREDIDMTRQVQQAAAVLEIGLRDHVIIGNGRWLSFRDEGLLG